MKKAIKPAFFHYGLLLYLLTFCVFPLVHAQDEDKDALLKRRSEIEESIKFTKKLIAETTSKQKSSIAYLRVINQQIQSREELISTYKEELSKIDQNIDKNKAVVTALEKDLKVLIEEYAEILNMNYRSKGAYHELVFIFSAGSFQEAYKRLKLLQYYADYRQKQVDVIRKTQASLSGRLEMLNRQKNEKEELLRKEAAAKEELLQDFRAQNNIIQDLREREEELKAQIKKEEKISKRLNAAIEGILKKEAEARKKMAEAEAKAAEKGAASKPSISSAEIENLTLAFQNKKGSLPWPVEDGFISGRFGRHAHPTIKGIYLDNNGVNIKTNKGAAVKPIFPGKVRYVISIAGKGKTVMVQHGEFYTVYSNLENVSVKPGKQLEVSDVMGYVVYDEDSGQSEFHLEIWKNTQKNDPEKWIKKK